MFCVLYVDSQPTTLNRIIYEIEEAVVRQSQKSRARIGCWGFKVEVETNMPLA